MGGCLEQEAWCGEVTCAAVGRRLHSAKALRLMGCVVLSFVLPISAGADWTSTVYTWINAPGASSAVKSGVK